MSRPLEKRALSTSTLETREKDGVRYISGVIPYDSMSEDMGYREVIRKGAFTKTLNEGDPRCLWAHNTQFVMGRKSAGTLTFEDRDDGLHFDCSLPKTSWAQDVFETVSRRDAPGVSFGFYVIKDSWTRGKDKEPAVRELLEVRLLEVSVGVAFPAYPASDSNTSTRDLFHRAGLNLDQLASVFANADGKAEYKCKGTEVDAVKSAIRALENLLPQERSQEPVQNEPELEATQEKPDESTFLARQRELELFEAEFKRL